MTPTMRRKEDTIQIRASGEVKALLNQAAALRGQKLSEFVLEAARREAELSILEQRIFLLDPAAHEAFLALLDQKAKPDPALRVRMGRRAVWEK